MATEGVSVDDEESKARRNLMVASTLVVLAWWLGVPFDRVSERFLGFAPSGQPFEWRVWSAALAALAYFALRFRFSPEHRRSIRTYAADQATYADRALTWWLRRELWMFARFGPGMYLPVMKSAFKTVAHAARNRVAREFGDAELGEIVQVHVTSAAFNKTKWVKGAGVVPAYGAGVAHIQFTIRTPRGDVLSQDGSMKCGFRLYGIGKPLAWTVTQLLVLVYSRSSTLLLLPWAMAALAFCIGVWKVFITW